MADSAIPDKNPYLLRAMHQWMSDSGQTPHIIVDATQPGVQVPPAHVKDGRIVLNVSLSATQHLALGNDSVEFNTRFGGRVYHVKAPITAVLGIYARETNEGMVFADHQPEARLETQADAGDAAAPHTGRNTPLSTVDTDAPPEPDAPPPPAPAPPRQRPSLKIVK